MLKIIKKEDIKPQKCSTKYTNQYQTDQHVEKLMGKETATFNLQQILKIYEQETSISSEILAQLIQKIVTNTTEQNIQENVNSILKLTKLSHDQKQLRYFLRNKNKIDANLLLLLLWNFKENQVAIYLVNVILDCYTAQLMLNGRQILILWRQYIRNRLLCQKSRQQLINKLQILSKNNNKQQKSGQSFRNVIIPL